jgi:hypothetical protein
MLCVKLCGAMVNPAREPLSGLVEADETMIPFRAKDDPVEARASAAERGPAAVFSGLISASASGGIVNDPTLSPCSCLFAASGIQQP